MQILHRFCGSIEQYTEELSDLDRYRPAGGLFLPGLPASPPCIHAVLLNSRKQKSPFLG